MIARQIQSSINIQALANQFHPLLFEILNKDLFYKIARNPHLGARHQNFYGVSKRYKLKNQELGVVCIYKFDDHTLEVNNFHIKDLK